MIDDLTDQQLTKAAAHAIGMRVSERKGSVFHWAGNLEWNPLEDDSTALRLFVSMGIQHSLAACLSVSDGLASCEFHQVHTERGGYEALRAATRRAIVIAAAKIAISRGYEV